ncbi:hypothetical protein FQR65_LT05648 [Abscondita terminalis]|nr:hypothetical protein FQR65_LT05648 [Abscondita terminalis]
MQLVKLLTVFFVACALPAYSTASEEYADVSEKLIKKELKRFEKLKDEVAPHQVDVVAEFSYSKADEDDSLIKRESFQLRPLAPPKPSNRTSATFTPETVKLIFDLAKNCNLTASASQEKFDKNGVLLGKTIFTESIMIKYEGGNTEVKVREDPTDEMDDDDGSEDLIGILKEFEMPVQAEVVLYDKSGEIIKTENDSFDPKKVRIQDAQGMTVDMQMKIAEALKRSCIMKETGVDRINLLVRYLGIQFPEYDFNAVIGKGSHSVANDISVKVIFEGDTYYIWGSLKQGEEEEE